MAIDFIPYEELFAHEYQGIYISSGGNIVVGPYTYNVFVNYTTAERQAQFQVCAKFLNWEISEIQEEWELCMYMYQWIIKSPSPFPYEQYTLSEDINMATWKLEGTPISILDKTASFIAIRTDVDDIAVYTVAKAQIDTENMSNNTPILDEIWAKHLAATTKKAAVESFMSALEAAGKVNLEARE